MPRLVASLVVLSLLAGPGCAPAVRTARAGRQAPAAVSWQTWRPEAFARARREHKLVLINVAAGWCHWCHVMDARTYQDPRVTAVLEAHFVAIRVDADARPDLAERYQRWGWPATAILTPDARPILERRGYQARDDFAHLLGRLAGELASGRPLARQPERGTTPAAPTDLERTVPEVRAFLDGLYDDAQGGWGRPQKYPWTSPVAEGLLRAHLHGEHAAGARALETAERYTRLQDPIWGGLYQYSTRGTWQHPHFEKIAAVQAGGIEAFVAAYRATGERRWLDHAWSVVRYLGAFLLDPEGGYRTSQDADAPGMDGHAFYALGDQDRRRHPAPRVDPHVYADLNGRLIEALCGLYQASLDPRALEAAEAAARRIQATHAGGAGRYRHEPGDEGPIHLADEVAIGRAFLALDEATGDPRWRAAAAEVAGFLLAQLQAESGGFFAHTLDPEAVGVFAERRKPFESNARAARWLAQLQALTEDARYGGAAVAALRAIAPETRRNGVHGAEYLMAIEELHAPRVHFTVVGQPDLAGTQALYRAALGFWEPRRILSRSEPGEQYPDLGRPAAYLCDDRSCSSPVTDPGSFAQTARAFLAQAEQE